MLLKYDQLNSPMNEPLVWECRGLIVDESDGWRVVCRAYDKFFNYGEPNAAPIDWTTSTVYEKLDGSVMTLYWYQGKWRVSSSGLPDASGPLNEPTMTFAELFWTTWRQLNYRLPAGRENHCFMFELMTPLNRVVVVHAQPRLVLHGVRELDTHQEIGPRSVAAELGWECVRSFPLGCLNDCLAAAKELRPMQAEGYVVCDAQFRRVKVKSPQYVALAHLKEGMSGRRLLEIMRANEADEFLGYFPEWTTAHTTVSTALNSLCAELEFRYQLIRDIPDQKTFAAEAIKTRCPGALFAMRKGDCKNALEFFAGCTLPLLERVVGIDLTTLLIDAVHRDPSE